MRSHSSKRGAVGIEHGGRRRAGLVLAAPFVAVFILTYVVPGLYAIYRSLFSERSRGLGFEAPERTFTWLGNFADVLDDADYQSSVVRLAEYVLICTPLMVAGSVALALMLDHARVRLGAVHRIAFFVPYAVPTVIASFIWGFWYLPKVSPVDTVTGSLGLPFPDLLGSSGVMFGIVNIGFWGNVGFNTIILYAALQAVPQEIYEAARLDGCNEWRLALRIKLPLIRPAVFLVGLFVLIGALQLINEPVILRTITPSVTSDFTPNLYAYTAGFTRLDFGRSAAAALMLAAVSLLLAMPFVRSALAGRARA